MLEGEYDSNHGPDVDMPMQDDVDAGDGVDIDGDVDIEWDGDDEEEENQEEEGKVDKDEKEEEDEHEHEDDGKKQWTIRQGERVNISGENVSTMEDNQRYLLPQQWPEMRERTPPPQPLAPAPRPRTVEPRPLPRPPETHPLSGMQHMRLVTPSKPRLVVPKLHEAETTQNTSEVDEDQQLLSESAGGDCLPDGPLLDVPLPNIVLPGSALDGSVDD